MQYMKLERLQIGQRLRVARLLASVTVEEAAAATQCEPIAVAAWERGKSLPCLVQFRRLLELYGVMACQILFDTNPWELTREEAVELSRASRAFSPSLQSRVDVFLALLAKGSDRTVDAR